MCGYHQAASLRMNLTCEALAMSFALLSRRSVSACWSYWAACIQLSPGIEMRANGRGGCSQGEASMMRWGLGRREVPQLVPHLMSGKSRPRLLCTLTIMFCRPRLSLLGRACERSARHGSACL